MESRAHVPSRRDVLTTSLAGSCSAFLYAQEARAEETPRDALLERAAAGTPHKDKVLLAVQAHADDIPLMAGGVVAQGNRTTIPPSFSGFFRVTYVCHRRQQEGSL